MKNKYRIEYQFSLPVYLLGLSVIVFLTVILALGTYILVIKDFHILILIFIWLLYGLFFIASIPKLIRTGNNILRGIPALILSDQNLIDNINNQQLDWKEIEEIKEYYDARSGSYIAIKVKNPEKYLSVKKSFFDRLTMKNNQKYCKGIFTIVPIQLKCKKQELLENLKSYLDRDRKVS